MAHTPKFLQVAGRGGHFLHLSPCAAVALRAIYPFLPVSVPLIHLLLPLPSRIPFIPYPLLWVFLPKAPQACVLSLLCDSSIGSHFSKDSFYSKEFSFSLPRWGPGTGAQGRTQSHLYQLPPKVGVVGGGF